MESDKESSVPIDENVYLACPPRYMLFLRNIRAIDRPGDNLVVAVRDAAGWGDIVILINLNHVCASGFGSIFAELEMNSVN